jgi:outer membrane protein OmpA-like peptidoglycan-associated protein
MQGGREQNFWPGFVDALSNLVLTLVFVLVIFVLSMGYLASKVSQSKMDTMCPEAKSDLDKAKQELEETRNALKVALSAPAGKVKESVDAGEKKPPPLKKEKVSTDASSSGSSIIIRYPMGVVELDDEAKQTLDKAIAPFLASGQQVKTILNAIPGPETFSEGKRLSFFRAVAIRNYLISKGVAKGNIDSKVSGHDKRDPNEPDGRVVIDLQQAAP